MKNRNITFTIILSVLTCFALSPPVRAPCQEGCAWYQNTALCDGALSDHGRRQYGHRSARPICEHNGLQQHGSGFETLWYNTTGIANTALGSLALRFNTTGRNNVAVGDALGYNTTGSVNTAIGPAALGNNTTGNYNIAVGFLAGNNSYHWQ